MTTAASPFVPSKLPLNLGLNDGTYMPQACVDVLKTYNNRLSLRNYSTADNDPLRAVIAEIDGVTPGHVFLHNGSGPILKQVIPYVLTERIKASKRRILQHFLTKNAYPIITPEHTYSKVPKKAAEKGIAIRMLPIKPETGFRVSVSDIEAGLSAGVGMVYLVNPNNPTGNVLISRDELEPLFGRYPEARFWIDEAYVQYVDPAKHRYFSDLVAKYPNVAVSRTFSFAYGLAAARIGYLLADPALVADLHKQLTDYRIGGLQEDLAIAALKDKDHLPWLRAECAREVAVLTAGFQKHPGIEIFPSDVNFIYGRFTDGRTGKWLAEAFSKRQIRIKHFEPFGDVRYDAYFRITLGTAEENRFLLGHLDQILAG